MEAFNERGPGPSARLTGSPTGLAFCCSAFPQICEFAGQRTGCGSLKDGAQAAAECSELCVIGARFGGCLGDLGRESTGCLLAVAETEHGQGLSDSLGEPPEGGGIRLSALADAAGVLDEVLGVDSDVAGGSVEGERAVVIAAVLGFAYDVGISFVVVQAVQALAGEPDVGGGIIVVTPERIRGLRAALLRDERRLRRVSLACWFGETRGACRAARKTSPAARADRSFDGARVPRPGQRGPGGRERGESRAPLGVLRRPRVEGGMAEAQQAG